MSNTESVHAAVGRAFPPAEPVEGFPGRFSRQWSVRASREIPADLDVGKLGDELATAARKALLEAHGDAVLGESGFEPRVGVVRVSAAHLAVTIDSPAAGVAFGNDAAIMTWVVLREVDARFGVEDLQGLPKAVWFAMR